MIINREKGFTLIEIAIVMVIIGLLMGGGVSIFRVLNERKTRNNTIDYLKEVKEALITYADIHGALPYPDTDGDGLQGPPVTSPHLGTIPYLTIGVQPKDSWSRNLKYEINASFCEDTAETPLYNRSVTCDAVRNGLGTTDPPLVVDADGGTSVFSAAAVIISAGPMDADSAGGVFDDVTTGSFIGDNTDGNPNYIRRTPTTAAGDEFDDLVTYIRASELYRNICEYLVLAVNNDSELGDPGFPVVYVYNETRRININDVDGNPSVPANDTGSYNIMSGTRIKICSALGGGGIVSSEPLTPITLSGQGCTIYIPEYISPPP